MKKLTLKQINQVVRDKGLVLLTFKDTKTALKLLCPKCDKHSSVFFHNLKKRKGGCSNCNSYTKYSFNDIYSMIKTKNGKVISEKSEYKNTKSHITVICNIDNHIWHPIVESILFNDRWCPKCAGNIKYTHEYVENVITKNGGKLLSGYKNVDTKIKIQCSTCQSIWRPTFKEILYNTWCPNCAQNKMAKAQNNSCIIKHWKTGKELICVASYEKAVVEYLNNNKIDFNWHPRFFKMPNGNRYYPDMYLRSMRKWIEIKGYFWGDAKIKWEWFKAIKPNSELWDEYKLRKMGII